MDTHAGHSEGMKPQREAPVQLDVVPLKSKADVEEAVQVIGGHNLLKEGVYEPSGEHGKWLQNIQTNVIDNREAAVLGFKENGVYVGFVLAMPDGAITQLRAAEGKETEVLKRAAEKLKDKGIIHPAAAILEKNERMRGALLAAGFIEKEKDEEGKIRFEKE